MKYIWQIVVALLTLAFIMLLVSTFESNGSDNTINSIMTRSSVRSYTDEEVSPAMVETILKAGMAAPTAGNRQPWEFYVVRDTNIIREFATVTKYADPMAQHALTAIVVCGVPSESFPDEPQYWVQDVSAASENILLAAHALGLGAVWCGVYPGEARVEMLRELLGVSEKLVPFNIIMLGHPDAEAVVKDKWKPAKVHFKN